MKLTPGLSDTQDTDSARPTKPNEYTAERLREIEELGYDPAFDRQALRQLQARNQ